MQYVHTLERALRCRDPILTVRVNYIVGTEKEGSEDLG